MKPFRVTLIAIAGSLGLAACGSSDDASEDAIADSVEMPADEAMADAPMPVEDTSPSVEEADDTDTVNEIEQNAQQAADEAQAAVDDVIAAAEENIENE